MNVLLLLGYLLAGAEEMVPLPDVGIELPQVIGALKFQEKRDYKEQGEGLGYSVTYANRLCRVSIFVYDRQLQNIPDGTTNQVIKDELKQAGEDIQLAADQGLYTNVKKATGDPGYPQSVTAMFTSARYTFDVPGGGCLSHILLTGFQKKIIKIRATQYILDDQRNDDELFEFLEAVTGKFSPQEPK